MQDVNPNSWGSWEHGASAPAEGAYGMYPPTYAGDPANIAPLTLRATREEAAFRGWSLSEQDEVDATNVAIAERLRLESSARPIGAMVAERTLEM